MSIKLHEVPVGSCVFGFEEDHVLTRSAQAFDELVGECLWGDGLVVHDQLVIGGVCDNNRIVAGAAAAGSSALFGTLAVRCFNIDGVSTMLTRAVHQRDGELFESVGMIRGR